MGCTVLWWLAPSPHSKRVPGSIPGWGLSVWTLHVLSVYVWVLSGYSGFLPSPKSMHVRSTWENLGETNQGSSAFASKSRQERQENQCRRQMSIKLCVVHVSEFQLFLLWRLQVSFQLKRNRSSNHKHEDATPHLVTLRECQQLFLGAVSLERYWLNTTLCQ